MLGGQKSLFASWWYSSTAIKPQTTSAFQLNIYHLINIRREESVVMFNLKLWYLPIFVFIKPPISAIISTTATWKCPWNIIKKENSLMNPTDITIHVLASVGLVFATKHCCTELCPFILKKNVGSFKTSDALMGQASLKKSPLSNAFSTVRVHFYLSNTFSTIGGIIEQTCANQCEMKPVLFLMKPCEWFHLLCFHTCLIFPSCLAQLGVNRLTLYIWENLPPSYTLPPPTPYGLRGNFIIYRYRRGLSIIIPQHPLVS